jgi:quercetin dioxygenase-like cupin family protein
LSDLIEQLFMEPITALADHRQRLEQLASAMMDLEENFEPALSHYKTDGLYGRRIYVPAPLCIATRVHRQAHFTIALKGECWVVDEEGRRFKVVAPDVFVTKPGTQRACLAITDVEWLTVHACEPSRDVSEMTDRLTCKSFADYVGDLSLLEG